MNIFTCLIWIIVPIIVIIILLILYKLEYFKSTEGINKLDSIIYINLENRADRKELLMKELESVNTDMTKVQKVNGVFIPKNGHKGCVQSHITALNIAKMNRWKYTLIFEDENLCVVVYQFNTLNIYSFLKGTTHESRLLTVKLSLSP